MQMLLRFNIQTLMSRLVVLLRTGDKVLVETSINEDRVVALSELA